jgi:glycosyltransferase involved in cell wall biosynthesis
MIKRVAVVIAAFNEGESIASVIAAVPKKINTNDSVNVIVIDDGSRDETATVAKKVGAIVLRHPINRGQGAALKTGFEYAKIHNYDVVVTFDADGQHRPEEIEPMVNMLFSEKVDVVLGSRFLGSATNMRFSRKLTLKLGILFTRIVSRIKLTDTHNGFRAIRVSALKKMYLVQDRMEHASEIIDQIAKHKLSFVEFPVTIDYTPYSLSRGQKSGAAIKIAGKVIASKMLK